MSYSNGIITAPVSIRDLQQCFGVSESDLGTIIAQVNINMWSRHKPIRYPSVKRIGFGDSDGSNEAKTVAYGLTPGNIKDGGTTFEQSDVTDLFEMEGYDWTYSKPTGGIAQPYRLTDFVNYYHNAVPFIVSDVPVATPTNPWTVNRANISYLRLKVTSDPDNSQYNLQGYDFDEAQIDLSEWYLGVLWGDTLYKGDTPITNADAGSFVTVQITTDMINHTYTVYVFLVRFDNSDGHYKYIKLPTAVGVNEFPTYIRVVQNNMDGGGGVPDARTNVWVIPDEGYTSLGWKKLDLVCEGSDASPKYRFINSSGNLCLKVKLQNSSSTEGTFYSGAFRVYNVERGFDVTPERMYVGDTENGTYTQTSTISVPAKSGNTNGVKYAILVFTQKDGTSIMKGTAGEEEVMFYIREGLEFYDTIYYKKGSAPAWQTV